MGSWTPGKLGWREPAALLAALAFVTLFLIHPLTHHDEDPMSDDDSDHCMVCAVLGAVSLAAPPPPPPPVPAPAPEAIPPLACPPAAAAFPLPCVSRSPPVISL